MLGVQAQPPAALQPGRMMGKRSGLMMATGVDPPAAQQQALQAQQAPGVPAAGPLVGQPAQPAADLHQLPLIMQVSPAGLGGTCGMPGCVHAGQTLHARAAALLPAEP